MSSQPYSSRKVLFSWEKKPSISKVTTTTPPPLNNHGDEIPIKESEILTKLLPPPPSCTQQQQEVEKDTNIIIPSTISTIIARNNNHHDFQDIPLPPCAFQPPYYRTSSKRGLWVGQDHQDDPFLAAYKECTKNDNNHHQRSGDGGERKKKKNKKLVNKGSGLMIESRLRKGLSFFSCKKFSSVHDNNNLVRISSFPNNNNNNIIDRD